MWPVIILEEQWCIFPYCWVLGFTVAILSILQTVRDILVNVFLV